MQSIGKTELARRIAADMAHVNTGIVEQVLEGAMRHIRQATDDGSAVTLKGFGTFKPKHREARIGRNPQTGAPLEIPARTTLGFTASKHRE
jgi:DNA-binding protein HU-beta